MDPTSFAASERAQLIERMLHSEPPWPRRLDGHIPRDLETVILKAIAKNQADRYASPADLARDVENWLADEPIDVYPEPWPQRAGAS